MKSLLNRALFSAVLVAGAIAAPAAMASSIDIDFDTVTAGIQTSNNIISGGTLNATVQYTTNDSTTNVSGSFTFDVTKFQVVGTGQNGVLCNVNNTTGIIAIVTVNGGGPLASNNFCNLTFTQTPTAVAPSSSPVPVGTAFSFAGGSGTANGGTLNIVILSPEFNATPAPGARTLNTVLNNAASNTIVVDNAAGDVGTTLNVTSATVTGVVGTSGVITVSPGSATVPQAGPAATFTVTCTGSAATTGTTTANIVFATNDAKDGVNETSVTYPYTCNVVASSLLVTPSPINLTPTIGGAAGTQVVSIQNVTASPVTVTSLTGLSGVLSISPSASFTIPANSTDTAHTVSCTPTNTTLVTQTLAINNSGAPATVNLTVNCTGQGPIFSGAPAAGSTVTISDPAGGAATTSNIVVTNNGNTALNVTGATGLSGVLSVAPTTATIAAAANQTFTVSCAQADAGLTTTQTLSFATNDSVVPTTKTYTVTCNSTGPELGVVNGAALAAFPGQNAAGNLSIQNSGTSALNLSACTATPVGFTVTIPASIPVGTTQIPISATAPGAPGGLVSGSITCNTDDANEPTVTFNFSVTALNPSIPALGDIGKVLLMLTLVGLVGFALRRAQ